jgi:hexokinase
MGMNSKSLPNQTILINTFQGAFDSFEHEHLPRTKYDQIIDETSNKPGEQAFEVCPRHITACVL